MHQNVLKNLQYFGDLNELFKEFNELHNENVILSAELSILF